MTNPYQSPTATDMSGTPLRQQAMLWYLKLFTAYLTLSIVTLPFVGKVWIAGEIPPLAFFQFPKLSFALWLRRDVVMPAVEQLGLSSGSFSPDYLMARPYGLLLAYLLPGLMLLLVLYFCGQLKGSTLKWAIILAATAVVDFFAVMYFGANDILLY